MHLSDRPLGVFCFRLPRLTVLFSSALFLSFGAFFQRGHRVSRCNKGGDSDTMMFMGVTGYDMCSVVELLMCCEGEIVVPFLDRR